MSFNRTKSIQEIASERKAYNEQLIARDAKRQVFDDFQKQKAQEAFLTNSVRMTALITPDMLVTQQAQELAPVSAEQEKELLFRNLSKIAEPKYANQIGDRLMQLMSPDEIKKVNSMFPAIVKKSKEMFASGVDITTYADFVINFIIEKEASTTALALDRSTAEIAGSKAVPSLAKRVEVNDEKIAKRNAQIEADRILAEQMKLEQVKLDEIARLEGVYTALEADRVTLQNDYNDKNLKLTTYTNALDTTKYKVNIDNSTTPVTFNILDLKSPTKASGTYYTHKGETTKFKVKYNDVLKAQSKLDAIDQKLMKLKQDITDIQSTLTHPSPPSSSVTFGTGFERAPRKKAKARVYKNSTRFMTGGASSSKSRYIQLNKYMVDIDQLQDKNIVSLKYVKNRNTHNKLKKTLVTDNVKKIIIELCKTGVFNENVYNVCNSADKVFVYNFCNICHIDVGDGIETPADDKQKQYDILLGELNAGNTNPKIIQELHKLLLDGIAKKEIPIQQGLQLLHEISKMK